MAEDGGGLNFWSTLSHQKRCLFVDQLLESEVASLFFEMDLEDKTQLFQLLDGELREFVTNHDLMT